MVTLTGLNVIYRFLLGEETSDYGKKHYLGKVTFDEAYKSVLATPQYKARAKQVKQAQALVQSQLPSAMR
jgi:hypothetical protein